MTYIPAQFSGLFDIDWTTAGANKLLAQITSGGKAYSFTSAPTISGANITAGSIPSSALPTVPVTKGGTNLTSYTTGDILAASNSATVTTISDVAVGQVLISKGAGVLPAYASTVPIGTGITFTANPGGGTAATLNDYEVGTWTPTDQSGASLALTITSANYVKIGRLVFVQMDITYPSTASASAALVSLPFNPSGSGLAALAIGYNSTATSVFARVDGSSPVIIFILAPSSGGAVANITLSTGHFVISGTYQSTS